MTPTDSRKNYIHTLQPDCIVIANNQSKPERTDICGFEYPYSGKLPAVGNTKPSEVCDKLQAGWFANPAGIPKPVHDLDYVVNKMLIPLNLNHSNYLLNCASDKRGILCDEVVEFLGNVGKAWDPNKTYTEKDAKEYPGAKKPDKKFKGVDGSGE